LTKTGGAGARRDVSPCVVRVYDSKKLCLFSGFYWISLDRLDDIYYNGVNKSTRSSKGTIMTLCDYCANPSTSTQVCTECGEPLVDNPEMDWREDDDGQPSELTEWMDFDPDC
jgi:hypothetical protein